MTFYHQKIGTPEQEIKLNLSKSLMNKYYNEYDATFKKLTKEERNVLWNEYLEAKRQVEIDFEPFGFIC